MKRVCPGCKKNLSLWDKLCICLSPHVGLWKLCHKCRKLVIEAGRCLAKVAYEEYKRDHMLKIAKYLEEKKEEK